MTKTYDMKTTLDPCPGCGREYRYLNKHRCKVEKPKPERSRRVFEELHPCPACGKNTRHQATHDRYCPGSPREVEEPHPCPACGRTVRRQAQHDPHCPGPKEVPRPHPCPQCGKVVTVQRKHDRYCPGKPIEPRPLIVRQGSCKKCGKTFKRLDLHEHTCKGRPHTMLKRSGTASAEQLLEVTTKWGTFALREVVLYSASEYHEPRSVLALFRYLDQDFAVVAPVRTDVPLICRADQLRKTRKR